MGVIATALNCPVEFVTVIFERVRAATAEFWLLAIRVVWTLVPVEENVADLITLATMVPAEAVIPPVGSVIVPVFKVPLISMFPVVVAPPEIVKPFA